MRYTNSIPIKDIPRPCIMALAGPTNATPYVGDWRRELVFEVDIGQARKHILSTGRWSEEEIEDMGDEEISEIILWLACCNFKEFLESDGVWGTDIYSLEE